MSVSVPCLKPKHSFLSNTCHCARRPYSTFLSPFSGSQRLGHLEQIERVDICCADTYTADCPNLYLLTDRCSYLFHLTKYSLPKVSHTLLAWRQFMIIILSFLRSARLRTQIAMWIQVARAARVQFMQLCLIQLRTAQYIRLDVWIATP